MANSGHDFSRVHALGTVLKRFVNSKAHAAIDDALRRIRRNEEIAREITISDLPSAAKNRFAWNKGFEIALWDGIWRRKVRDEEWHPGRPGALEDAVDDFRIIHDSIAGPHAVSVRQLTKLFGWMVLSVERSDEYQRLKANHELPEGWLQEHAAPAIRSYWQFMVYLVRALMRDEYSLTATEVYFLGLADEVTGTHLPSWRTMAAKCGQLDDDT